MFLMCAESYKTAFAYFYLGVASYNLGEYDESEKVLALVNTMDPTHAATWAYIALVLLKKPNPPLNAAYQTMNEAIKLNLNDGWILQEIALAWISVGSYKGAREAFETSIFVQAGSKQKNRVQAFVRNIQ